MSEDAGERKDLPKSLSEAVDYVIERMSPGDREELRKLSKSDLVMTHFGLGMWIRNELGLWGDNQELLADLSGPNRWIHPDDVSTVIVEAVWRRLRKEPRKPPS
jgi:hypothetical protein